MDSVKCSNCGFLFTDSAEHERIPCPECSSTNRIILALVTEGIRIFDGLGFKVKDPKRKGKSKVKTEGFHKYVKSRLANLVRHERVIDREKDHYKEKVTDVDTGKVLHSCEEPLIEHQRHGSDK